jgi:uncharacterized protein (DUF2141 family)
VNQNHFFFFLAKTGRHFSIWLIFVLLLSSCAQVVAPSGGKKDERAPFPRKYAPDSVAVHFKSKTVEIQFDEYVELKDLSNQLIISPPMNKLPEIRVRSKTLLITFKEPLKDSTTYTINLGNAVQDIHENNPIRNFRYVFSTGSYVDSLSLKGSVINALTLTPEKGVLVMLYKDLTDSVPYTHVPSYFGRTDDNGNYRISNVKGGIYKVFALRDANSNYKINPGEMMGFAAEPIKLFHNDTLNFLFFKEDVAVQKLFKGYQAAHGKIVLAFAKPVEGLKLKPLNFSIADIQKSIVETNVSGDTATFWFTSPKKDSLLLEVRDKDKIYDTLRFKLITRAKMISLNKGETAKLAIKTNAGRDRPLDLNTPIVFEFARPVFDNNPELINKLILRRDTIKKNIFKEGRFQRTELNGNARMQTWTDTSNSIKENTTYHLLILPGAFKDMLGFTNDTIRADFKTQELKYYGTLKMHVHIAKGKYLLQLLDEKDGVVREQGIEDGQQVYFEYLNPAKYRTRLIVDSDGNGKWSTGNYMRHLQPERVIYNVQSVMIRSNWDQEVDWYVK